MLARIGVIFRWIAVWTFPTVLLAGCGFLLVGSARGAVLAVAYPVWLGFAWLSSMSRLRRASPPVVGSGGQFQSLLPNRVRLEVVRDAGSWAMATRAPFGRPRVQLSEGLLHQKNTREIQKVLREMGRRTLEPSLGLRTLAASLGLGQEGGNDAPLPFVTLGMKVPTLVVAARLMRWSLIRFMERLLGAPILGGKERLAIRY